MLAWQRVLAHRAAEDFGGLPVGVVIVGAEHANALRRLLKNGTKMSIPVRTLRTLQVATNNDEDAFAEKAAVSAPLLMLRLPPGAATLFESGKSLPVDIQEIFLAAPAVFLRGVRGLEPELEGDVRPRPVLENNLSARFTFAEVFAGIGGFRVGLEHIGGQCTFACELDAAACNTYRLNWPDDSYETTKSQRLGQITLKPPPHSTLLFEGDILDVPGDILAPFDILTGGFPCQTFSKRGAQTGMEIQGGDWGGCLYLELVRLLRDRRPKAFIFENVTNLVLMGGGTYSRRTGETTVFTPGSVLTKIVKEFAACGYDVSWRVLNARHHVPQYRERVYIVGLRQDMGCNPFDWSGLVGLKGDGKREDQTLAGGCIRDILEASDSPDVIESTLTVSQWATIQAQMSARGEVLQRDRMIPLDGKSPTLISSYRKSSNITSKFICEEIDGTIRDGSGDGIPRPRFLTPRECARVMGFPEDFRIPSSAHLAGFYKQIGNAVCPPVISAIGQQVLLALEASVAL